MKLTLEIIPVLRNDQETCIAEILERYAKSIRETGYLPETGNYQNGTILATVKDNRA